jgi:DNA-directed RNA polymerase specialized sigma24 family protein
MTESRQPLVDPGFHRALRSMIARRVPESDVDDIVQSALADALASPTAPREAEALRKWIWVTARNKIADFYRRNKREPLAEPTEIAVEPAAEEQDFLRWAERELPPGSDAPKTLEWMIREGEGDKIANIAREEAVPAPRIRQRVSRLRRHFRARWAQQAAVLATLGIVVTLAVLWIFRKNEPRPIARDVPRPVDSAREMARGMRQRALGLCDGPRWKECLDELDRARGLDPAGDSAGDVIEGRRQAADAKLREEAPPAPSAQPSSLPPELPKEPPKATAPVPTGSTVPVPKAAPKSPQKPTSKPSDWEDPKGKENVWENGNGGAWDLGSGGGSSGPALRK